jgi:hypothetical protein
MIAPIALTLWRLKPEYFFWATRYKGKYIEKNMVNNYQFQEIILQYFLYLLFLHDLIFWSCLFTDTVHEFLIVSELFVVDDMVQAMINFLIPAR